MSKITLNNLASLQNETSAINTINGNNDILEAAMDNTLSRDGTAPNYMESNLDMNSNKIINLPDATSDTEPVTLKQFTDTIGSLDPDIPIYGIEGYVLTANNPSTPATFQGFKQSNAGALTRTINGKESDLVSILDYIPEAEHAAIKAGTSNFDCTYYIQTQLDQGTSLYFPEGRYRITSGLIISVSGQIMKAASQKTVIWCDSIGATTAIISSGTNIVQYSNIEGFTLRGNVNVSYGLKLGYTAEGIGWHRSSFIDLRIRDVVISAVWAMFSVGSYFENLDVSSNEGAFIVKPVNGILSGDGTNNGDGFFAGTFINAIVEGVSGAGIYIRGGGTNQFLGGLSEGNGIGIQSDFGYQNVYYGLDLEANSTANAIIAGNRNMFINMVSAIVGGGNNGIFRIMNGNQNYILGGDYSYIQIDNTASYTVISWPKTPSSLFTDNSATSVVEYFDITTNSLVIRRPTQNISMFQNAPTALSVYNTSSGANAYAGVVLNSDAGQAILRQISSGGGGASQLTTSASNLLIDNVNASGNIIMRTGTTPSTAMTLNSAQKMRLNSYGIGALVSDASGNITEVRGQIPGTNTNNNASSGNVGEYLSDSKASGAAVAVANATPTQIATITLTAGDWDVWIDGYVKTAAGTTNISEMACSISQSATVLDESPGKISKHTQALTFGGAAYMSMPMVGPIRFSVSSNTQIYFLGYVAWTTTQPSVYGIIQARRVR